MKAKSPYVWKGEYRLSQEPKWEESVARMLQRYQMALMSQELDSAGEPPASSDELRV